MIETLEEIYSFLIYLFPVSFGLAFIGIILLLLTRWVKLNDLNFDIINWSVKDKFIDILH